MAKITILDIKPTGADLFDDSESFMSELSNDELEQAMGGRYIISPYFPSQPKLTLSFPPKKTLPPSPVYL